MVLRVKLKKIIKKTCVYSFLSLIFIVIVLTILNAVNFIPFTGIVSNQISKALGRTVKVEGVSFGYSFNTGINVYLDNLAIDNPTWVPDTDPKLLSVSKLKISLILYKLLNGKVVITNVKSSNAHLFLLDNGKKQKNWVLPVFNNNLKNKKLDASYTKENYDNANYKDYLQLPKIGINDFTLTYKNKVKEFNANIKNFQLQKAEIIHNQLKGHITIDNHKFFMKGNFSQLKDIFTTNGMNYKITINSDQNDYISLIGGVSIQNRLSISSKVKLKVEKPIEFAKFFLNDKKILDKLDKFENIHVQAKLTYGESKFISNELQANFNYKGNLYHLDLTANSESIKRLYPLILKAKLTSFKNKILLDGKILKPLSKTKWLDLKLKAQLTNLAEIDKKLLGFGKLDLTTNIEANANTVKLKQLSLLSDYKKNNIVFNSDMKFDIWNSKKIKVNYTSQLQYANNASIKAQGYFHWPITKKNWLDTTVRGKVKNLNKIFADFKLELPEKITNINYNLNISSNVAKTLTTNLDNLLLQVNGKQLKISADIKSIINPTITSFDYAFYSQLDHKNKLTISGSGQIGNDMDFTKNFNISTIIKGEFTSASEFNFLWRKPLPELKLIKNIAIDTKFNLDDKEFDLSINKIASSYENKPFTISGNAVYGLYRANNPINYSFYLNSEDADKVQLSGSGFLKDKQASINIFANIADLNIYSNLFGLKLPTIKQLSLKTNFELDKNKLSLSNFNLTGSSNGYPLTLNLGGYYNLDNKTFLLNNMLANLNGFKVRVNAQGTNFPDLNITGNLYSSAVSLANLNQLIANWDYGYLPNIVNYKLNFNFKANKSYIGINDFNYEGSGSDINGNIEANKTNNLWVIKSMLMSNTIDVAKLKKVIQEAKSDYKLTDLPVSNNSVAKKVKMASSAKDSKKIEQLATEALKQKTKIPKWMKIPIANIFKYYDIKAQLKVKQIIFPDSITKNLLAKILLKHNILNVDLSADQFFAGELKVKVDMYPSLVGDYNLQSNIYLGVINAAKAIKDLTLEENIPSLKEGRLMFNSILKSNGRNIYQLLDNLNGRTKIGMDKIKYATLNKGIFSRLITLLSGGGYSNSMEVKCAYANFNIVKGIFNLKELLVDMTGLIINGNGEINLPKQNINLLLEPKAKYVSLASLASNIKVAGTFKNVYVYPDTIGAVVSAGKTAAWFLTGIGAVGLIASKVTTGVYNANVSYCENALAPLPKQEKENSIIKTGVTNTMDFLGF